MKRTDMDPPADVPDVVVTELRESTDSQLREIIHYAQQLLDEDPLHTDAIEPRAGEELVRVEDHDAYTIAVVRRPDETGEAQGPFTYRLKWIPSVGEEEDGKYEWHYLGRTDPDSEGPA